MPDALMHLKILLPFHVFADKSGVSGVVVDTAAGSFGFLPHRLDCVAAIVPGILIYETQSDGEVFVAVDEGTVIKTGMDVLVSVRRAQAGTDLAELRDAVDKEFLTLSEQERSTRAVMARMESGFIHQMAKLHHD